MCRVLDVRLIKRTRAGKGSRRQGHDEATAAIIHHFAASIAPMAARDLPYQCQTQPGSAAVGCILGAIERPEHVFNFRLRYAGTTVPYRYDGGVGVARDPHPGGRGTMA